MPKPRREAIPETLRALHEQLVRKDEQNALLESLLHDANRRADEQQRLLERMLQDMDGAHGQAPPDHPSGVPEAAGRGAPPADEPFEVTARLDRRTLAAGHAALRPHRRAAAIGLVILGSLAVGVWMRVRPAAPLPGPVAAAPRSAPSAGPGEPAQPSTIDRPAGAMGPALVPEASTGPAGPQAGSPPQTTTGPWVEPEVSIVASGPAPAAAAARKGRARAEQQAAAARRTRPKSAPRLARPAVPGPSRPRTATVATARTLSAEPVAPPERWVDPPQPPREPLPAEPPVRRSDDQPIRSNRPYDPEPAAWMGGADPERRVNVRICTDTWLRAGPRCRHTTTMNMPLDHAPTRQCTARHGD